MKAILLARVSSKEQEEGQSIPAQVRRLNEYAAYRHLTVEHVFQITESSTKETRKEFEKILTLLRKSKEKMALIADTIDRVQRSFKNQLHSMNCVGMERLRYTFIGKIWFCMKSQTVLICSVGTWG